MSPVKWPTRWAACIAKEVLLRRCPTAGAAIQTPSSRRSLIRRGNAMSGTAPVLVSLLQGLSDTEWEVRARSACALGDLAVQAKGAIPALVSLLSDPHWYVRGRSAWALAKIGVET